MVTPGYASRTWGRAAIALFVCLGHLAVLAHTAYFAHTVSSSGEVVHTHGLNQATADAHHTRHTGATWCGEHIELQAGAEVACVAAKFSHLSTGAPEVPVSFDRGSNWSQSPSAFRFARNPLSVLSCSPKASPPALS